MTAIVPTQSVEIEVMPELPVFADLPLAQAHALLVNVAMADVPAFADVFNFVAVPKLGSGCSFEVLRAFVTSDREACEMAVRSAQSNDFMYQLADTIAIRRGDTSGITARMLGSRGTRHLAEGVLDPVNGLLNTAVLGELCQVNNSICLVSLGYKAMGTGILIDHNLVLTAAHVLDNCGYLADGSANTQLRDNVTFRFNSPHLTAGPYTAQLADDWLVAYSQSCITRAGHALSAASAGMLDYALVRLSAAVPSHVRRLCIERGGRLPPVPLSEREKLRRYYVLGYPGGTDSKFSIGTIDNLDIAAARIIHKCNSAAGMSGAPLLDDNARLVGFHEGKITDAEGMPLFNRATMLTKVAAAIANSRTAQPPSAQYIEHRSVRQAWAAYAVQTVATAPASWTNAMDAARIDLEGISFDQPLDNFYPVFTVHALEAWLSMLKQRSARDQVLMLGGSPGTGKSFALNYAQARLGNDQVLTISPEVSSELPLSDMLTLLYPGGDFNDPWRTFDGRMRNTYVTSVLDYFERLAAATSSGTLLIAVDCDPDAAFWTEAQHFWKQFSLVLGQRPSLRLLLCGPSDELRDDLIPSEIAYEECRPINEEQIRQFCEGLAHQLGRRNYATWAADHAAAMWNDPTRPAARQPQLAMCDAARIVLIIRQKLLALESTLP
jgi:hypothetical protein